MGRVRTAAAKKYIGNDSDNSDDEPVTSSKRSSGRAKRNATASTDNSKSGPSSSRRSARQSTPAEKQNGKNGKASDDDDASGDSSSEDEVVQVSRKRKSSVENASPKKSKPSTSSAASTSKSKSNESRPKKEKSSKKKKTDEDEGRYEVEEILDHKFENNRKYFLIRWKGYDSSVDSWENSRNISCPALLAKYYEDYPEASQAPKTVNSKKKKKNLVPRPRQLKIDEQLDYDDEWDENEDYEVEKVLDVYIHRNNKREFLIRWKGYSSKSDSWEPEENLDCKDLIERFMEKVDQMKNVSLKELRPVRSQTQRFTLMTQGSARRLSKRNPNKQRAVYYDCDE